MASWVCQKNGAIPPRSHSAQRSARAKSNAPSNSASSRVEAWPGKSSSSTGPRPMCLISRRSLWPSATLSRSSRLVEDLAVWLARLTLCSAAPSGSTSSYRSRLRRFACWHPPAPRSAQRRSSMADWFNFYRPLLGPLQSMGAGLQE